MTQPPPYEPPAQGPPPHGTPPPPPPPPYPAYQPYPSSYGPPSFPPPPQPRRSRALPTVIAIVAAVVLLAVAILVPVLLSQGDDDVEATKKAPSPSGDVDTSTLDAVAEYDGLTNQHVEPDEAPDYPQSPAVGGDHAPYWLECGVYDEPIPEVSAVHDLEHGTTWLTYRADLVDADGIERLAEQLPDNGIMSPYPGQEAPVVITVWGRQLELVGPEDPRIGLFVTEYGAGDTAPEPYASCHGGISPDDILGGVAA